MQEQDIKKVKTLLDFEETDKDFDKALEDLDTDDGEDLRELDINISIEGCREHGVFQWSEWTDEQIAEFNELVLQTAADISYILITNNQKYKSAYWWVRKACEAKYGDPTIPYFVHSYEKTLRCGADGDDEDAKLDKLGYEFLEYVCQKLDENWCAVEEAEDSEELSEEDIETLMQMDCAVPEFGEVPEIPDFLKEQKKKKTCDFCGKKLKGLQRRFCSDKCRNTYWNRVKSIERKKAKAEA